MQAEPRESRARLMTRSPAFEVPDRLRPRVNFWIDIFTRFGKNQGVVHHREFPQAIFSILDFNREAETLSPIQLEQFRKRREREAMLQVKAALMHLASGVNPAGPFEQRVQEAMRLVPGGSGKYAHAAREDLVRIQTGIREKFEDSLKRSGRYIRQLETIFAREYGLPIELTRIPFIESSFDYLAYSSVGAAGIWQFMRPTARHFGLAVTAAVDDRRDPIAATRAAAGYLKHAYGELGTWPLAITSYNHGIAGVAHKVRQMGTSDLAAIIEHPREQVFGFASNNFYPEFLAALEVYDNYHAYFPALKLEAPLEYVERRMDRPATVGYLARQLGVSVEDLRQCNYALSEGVWRGQLRVPAGYTLKIPREGQLRIADLSVPEPEPTKSIVSASAIYGGIQYTVRKGDSLKSIARKYGLSPKMLQSLNGLTSKQITVGQVLTVKQGENKDTDSAKGGTPKLIRTEKASTSPQTYKVKSGDSLWSISRKRGISVEALKTSNPAAAKGIKPGQVLRLP